MSAHVIRMVAVLEQPTNVLAGACLDCQWYNDPTDDEQAARLDAYRHNAEKHGGADVVEELVTEHELTMVRHWMASHERSRRPAKWSFLVLIGMFPLQLLAWGAPPFSLVAMSIVAAMAAHQARWWGRHEGAVKMLEIQVLKLEAEAKAKRLLHEAIDQAIEDDGGDDAA